LKEQRQKLSVLSFLFVIQFLLSAVTLFLYGMYQYNRDAELFRTELIDEADRSLLRLRTLIPDYIVSHQEKKIESLIFTEISTNKTGHILAIFLETPAPDGTFFITGLYRDKNEEVLSFSSLTEETKEKIKNSFHTKKSPIYDGSGNLIGNISTYVASESFLVVKSYLLAEIIASIFVLFIVQFSLYYFLVRKFFILPLEINLNKDKEPDSGYDYKNLFAVINDAKKSGWDNKIRELFLELTDSRETLKSEQEKLEFVLEDTNAGTWIWNVKTGETVFNERWAGIIGYKLSELEPVSINTWLDNTHPDDLELSEKRLREYFEGKTELYECEARVKHKNGSWVWVLDKGRISKRDANGDPVELFGTHVDITKRKNREENQSKENTLEYAKADEDYKKGFKYIHLGMIIFDELGTIIDANTAFLAKTGYAITEIVGKHISMFKSDVHDEGFYKNIYKTLLETGHWRGGLTIKSKQGLTEPELVNVSKIKDNKESLQRYVVYLSDLSIDEDKPAVSDVNSDNDMLTGLPTRTAIETLFSGVTGKNNGEINKFVLLFIDLDNFKKVNEIYGDLVGDQVIRLLADRLKSLCHEGDVLVRLAGDEFLVMFTEAHHEMNCSLIARNVLQTISEPVIFEDFNFTVTASIGVTVYSGQESVDISVLIKQADMALYSAKVCGHNCYSIYDQSMIEFFNRSRG
jgi:diguanylate cyclase (GGDEF)-like protein/PAS domain S-box-containing protein